MIFKKDVAHIRLYLKEEFKYAHPYEIINGQASRYDLNVDQVVKELKECIEKDKMILLDGDTIGTSGGDVEYFEITNYDELLELKKEREENAE